jgi:hypothetical protein
LSLSKCTRSASLHSHRTKTQLNLRFFKFSFIKKFYLFKLKEYKLNNNFEFFILKKLLKTINIKINHLVVSQNGSYLKSSGTISTSTFARNQTLAKYHFKNEGAQNKYGRKCIDQLRWIKRQQLKNLKLKDLLLIQKL